MTDQWMPVATDLHEYRVAAAELPRSTRLTEERKEAIVVIPGGLEWAALVRDAAAAGARALVVVEPDAAMLVAPAVELPVLVDRRLLPEPLRATIDARRTVAPRAIVIEAAAAPADVRAALRDAAGWARVLGGPVEPGDAASTDAFVVATGTAGGIPMTITVTVLADGQASRLRATAIGTTTTEVVVDPFAGIEHVEIRSVDGRTTLPARYESTARSTLRRALASDARCADLGELLADDRVTAAVLGT